MANRGSDTSAALAHEGWRRSLLGRGYRADMDDLEVGVAFELDTTKNIARADEEADINQLLYFPIHGSGGSDMEATEGVHERM